MRVHQRCADPTSHPELVVALALGIALCGCSVDLSTLTRVQPLEETRVLGKSGPKIVLLEIEGVISEERQRAGTLGVDQPSLVARVREALDRAEKDDDVAALLLRIQSPGGTVSASETIHHEVQRWKQKTGRKAVAHLQGLATSGGYYVAMAADHVVAHPTTVTGSIGVIMIGLNFAGLMEKLGISNQTLTSGDFKDAGSPLREMRPEERAQLQGVIDDLYARFREVVAAGRPALSPDALGRLADGRIFTARQALADGLIDEIGYLDSAIEATEKLAGIDESRVVTYHRPSEYRDNVYSRGPLPPVQVVDIDVLSLPHEALAPGFYYLWPALLP